MKEEEAAAAAVEKDKKVDVNDETSSTNQVENAEAKVETTETISEISNEPNKINSIEVDKINNLNVSAIIPSQGTIVVNLPKEPKQPDFNPDDPQALEAFILFEMQSFKSRQTSREKYYLFSL